MQRSMCRFVLILLATVALAGCPKAFVAKVVNDSDAVLAVTYSWKRPAPGVDDRDVCLFVVPDMRAVVHDQSGWRDIPEDQVDFERCELSFELPPRTSATLAFRGICEATSDAELLVKSISLDGILGSIELEGERIIEAYEKRGKYECRLRYSRAEPSP